MRKILEIFNIARRSLAYYDKAKSNILNISKCSQKVATKLEKTFVLQKYFLYY